MQAYEHSRAAAVLPRSAEDVWQVLRDFNNYPTYIRAVEESLIEDALSGTTVGAVRRFRMGQLWTRQRLVALSDVERTFAYESLAPTRTADDRADVEREMTWYRGSVQLHPTTVDGQCCIDWSVSYRSPANDVEYWSAWWAQAIPEWLRDVGLYFAA